METGNLSSVRPPWRPSSQVRVAVRGPRTTFRYRRKGKIWITAPASAELFLVVELLTRFVLFARILIELRVSFHLIAHGYRIP
jgi:hypothetical protein